MQLILGDNKYVRHMSKDSEVNLISCTSDEMHRVVAWESKVRCWEVNGSARLYAKTKSHDDQFHEFLIFVIGREETYSRERPSQIAFAHHSEWTKCSMRTTDTSKKRKNDQTNETGTFSRCERRRCCTYKNSDIRVRWRIRILSNSHWIWYMQAHWRNRTQALPIEHKRSSRRRTYRRFSERSDRTSSDKGSWL